MTRRLEVSCDQIEKLEVVKEASQCNTYAACVEGAKEMGINDLSSWTGMCRSIFHQGINLDTNLDNKLVRSA